MKKIIGVIGGHICSNKVEDLAYKLGVKLAKVGDYLVCGGLSGVMNHACKGFRQGGGVTIGIIPGYNKSAANKYVDIVIPSGMGLARNVLVVKSADVVVAFPGRAGTLSEIAYCLQFNIPVIGFKYWNISGVIRVDEIDKVVKIVKDILSKVVLEDE
jgi:uncharacterized protein (TIGR00725 family)